MAHRSDLRPKTSTMDSPCRRIDKSSTAGTATYNPDVVRRYSAANRQNESRHVHNQAVSSDWRARLSRYYRENAKTLARRKRRLTQFRYHSFSISSISTHGGSQSSRSSICGGCVRLGGGVIAQGCACEPAAQRLPTDYPEPCLRRGDGLG